MVAGKKCDDKRCPFHGSVSLRGRSFTGTVVSTKMHDTATVEWVRKKLIPKYERSEKRKTKIHAHVPKCLDIRVGEEVVLNECRPLSKTKHFVIIKKFKKEENNKK